MGYRHRISRSSSNKCSVEGCEDKYLASGLCRKHYLRVHRTGTTDPSSVTIAKELSAFDRLMLRINKLDNGCWIYSGRVTKKGYVHVKNDKGLMRFGHVIVYEHFYGKIPDNLEIDHKCERRACLNPDHLEAVTHTENVRRAVNARKSDWGFGSLNENDRHMQAKFAANIRWKEDEKGLI
jgi:HNH endonuclease